MIVIPGTNLNKVSFKFSKNYPKLSKKQIDEIEKNWQQKLSKNKNIFNGTHFGGFLKNKTNKYNFIITKTNYKQILYLRKVKKYIKGSQNVAVRVLTYNDKGVFLTKRSKNLVVNPGKYCFLSGNLDYKKLTPFSKSNFLKHAKNIAYSELVEEAKQGKNFKVSDLNLQQIVYLPKLQDISIDFALKVNKLSPINSENEKIALVKYNEINSFIKQNKNNMLLVTPQALKLLKQKYENK